MLTAVRRRLDALAHIRHNPFPILFILCSTDYYIVLTMAIMPETPRWLVIVDQHDEARRVLNKVFGSGIEIQEMAEHVLKGIEKEVREEEEAKKGRQRGQTKKERNSWLAAAKDNWAELFRIPGNRRALTIACLLQGLQQLCGFVGLSARMFILS